MKGKPVRETSKGKRAFKRNVKGLRKKCSFKFLSESVQLIFIFPHRYRKAVNLLVLCLGLINFNLSHFDFDFKAGFQPFASACT